MRTELISIMFFSLITSISYAASIELGGSYVDRNLEALVPESNPDFGLADGNNAGIISEKSKFSPYLSIHSKERYFGSSQIGWYVNANLGKGVFSEQAANGDAFGSASNRGTRVDAKYIYLAPMIFVRIGPKFAEEEPDRFATTLGVGYGISYVSLSGNMILNGLNPYPTIPINEKRSARTYSFFLGTEYKHWFLRLSITNMVIEEATPKKYDLETFENSITIGHRFNF